MRLSFQILSADFSPFVHAVKASSLLEKTVLVLFEPSSVRFASGAFELTDHDVSMLAFGGIDSAALKDYTMTSLNGAIALSMRANDLLALLATFGGDCPVRCKLTKHVLMRTPMLEFSSVSQNSKIS